MAVGDSLAAREEAGATPWESRKEAKAEEDEEEQNLLRLLRSGAYDNRRAARTSDTTADRRMSGEEANGEGQSSGEPPLSIATNGFRAPVRGGSESGESAEIVTGKALTPDSEGSKSPRAATAALVLALD